MPVTCTITRYGAFMERQCILCLCLKGSRSKNELYDTEWNLQPFRYNYPASEKTFEKPDNLDKMLQLAEVLAKDFIHAR